MNKKITLSQLLTWLERKQTEAWKRTTCALNHSKEKKHKGTHKEISLYEKKLSKQ